MNDYLKHRQEFINKGRPLPDKKTYKISPKSEKRLAKEKQAKDAGQVKPVSKLELDVWYNEIKERHWYGWLPAYCGECGDKISVKYSRHTTAHLLPKKLFPSVATHPDNYLILGASCGCHDKTHRIDKFVTMKVWPEAARRIKIMIPLLPFDELKYLSSQLLTALDNV